MRATVGVRRRARDLAGRAISKVVTAATDSHYRRIYYSPRWHPRLVLLERALDETVDYITANMRDAVIRDDATAVLSHALRHCRVPGLHLEFGVSTGSTIDHIARIRRAETIWGFDSFEGLPEDWSGYTLTTGTFRRSTPPPVEPNVELVVGWFDETLPAFLDDHTGPVAFVHVDSDLYSSARTILDHLGARLQVGSVIVFNEYFNYPNWQQHEFRAWQEYCATTRTSYEYLCWAQYEVAVRVTAVDAVPPNRR